MLDQRMVYVLNANTILRIPVRLKRVVRPIRRNPVTNDAFHAAATVIYRRYRLKTKLVVATVQSSVSFPICLCDSRVRVDSIT